MEPGSLALVLYSAQVLLVVCVAAPASGLLHRSAPGVRLAYWRGIGIACLALPLLASPRADVPALSVEFGAAATVGGITEPTSPIAGVGAWILWIWAAGVIVRLFGIAAGALRLRQLRRGSVPATPGHDIDALRTALAPRAEFRWSSDVGQPVTFGVGRPVILLPQTFTSLHEDAQRAVACHELHHVARRDWLWILVEEHVRAAFWFHPAVWWIVERVQLAREQVVDELVVTRTPAKTRAAAKKAYMQALLTFADQDPHARLSLAFLRRRHLKSRFQQLSKESHMSHRRLAWTAAALVTVMLGTSLGAARAFPVNLHTLVQQAIAATTLEIRLAEPAPAAGLVEATVPGSRERIYLHSTVLATEADVSSAAVVEGRGAADAAVGVTFNPAAAARLSKATAAHVGRPMAIVVDGNVVASMTVRGPIGESAMITGITRESAGALAARLSRVVRTQGDAGAPARKPTGVVLPSPVVEVKPQYNPAAMQAGIEGTVLMETVVLADGSVGDVTVVRSLDETYGLDQAAIDAMKQWRFRPGTQDGNPVRVAVTVEMTFTLK